MISPQSYKLHVDYNAIIKQKIAGKNDCKPAVSIKIKPVFLCNAVVALCFQSNTIF